MGKHNETGARGEQLAEVYLKDHGYEILHRNWRHGHKEIDIIALDGAMLVFVEIKARSDFRFGFPEESVDRRKQSHIRIAAAAFLEEFPDYRTVRFDVVAIVFSGGAIEELKHLIDAF